MQSGLYQPGRGRRSPCPQEMHKFLAADACFNFHAWRKKAIWLSEGLPTRATFFLRGLSETAGQASASVVQRLAPNNGTRSAP